MTLRYSICLAFLMAATPALAGLPGNLVSGFGAAPLTEMALSDIRGTAAPLTRGALRAIGDRQFDDSQRFIGAIGRTQMDVWWGSDGSQLIAEAVRDAQLTFVR